MAISEETFFLPPDAEGTLQNQIQQLVAEAILSGRFRAGEKMPSSRKLAAHLGVSRITVTLAYTELLADDYLTSRGRSGYYISTNAPQPPKFPIMPREDKVDWVRAIGQKFSGGVTLTKPSDWGSYKYPFIYGQADETLFDRSNWRLCALQALGSKDYDALTSDYFDRDDPKLIEFILRHTLPRRGIRAEPDEVLVTMGAQNALWLTANVLLNQRRTAALENPCYPSLRDILTQSRCQVASVAVDAAGLPPDALPSDVDVVFTTPSHQCPTATTMPLERRRTLLARAAEPTQVDVETSKLIALAVIASLAALQLARVQLRFLASTWGLYGSGWMAGVATGLASVGGMVVALYVLAQNAPPREMRASLVLFLFLGSVTTALSLLAFGLMDRTAIARGLAMAGPAALGVILGQLSFIPRWEHFYKPFCLLLLLALASWGILRMIFGI